MSWLRLYTEQRKMGHERQKTHHFTETRGTDSLPHLMFLKHLIEQLVKILKLTYEGLRVISGRRGDYSI